MDLAFGESNLKSCLLSNWEAWDWIVYELWGSLWSTLKDDEVKINLRKKKKKRFWKDWEAMALLLCNQNISKAIMLCFPKIELLIRLETTMYNWCLCPFVFPNQWLLILLISVDPMFHSFGFWCTSNLWTFFLCVWERT